MGKAIVVIEARGVQAPYVLTLRGEWPRIAEEIRAALAKQMDGDRCGSVVVSVHFADDRCDHGVG